MSTNRYDLYKDVHKGIRKELFDLGVLAGSTDFENETSLNRLKEHFNRSYNLLETHAHSEDTHVEPLIQKVNTDAATKLADTHNKLEKGINKLQQQLNSMNTEQTSIAQQGQQFYLQLTLFISKYLQHIADEEQIISPQLWENYDDETLLNLSVEIRASIPPPVMNNFLACMVPAMNHPERVMMFGGMKQAAPEEVFNGVCMLAQGILSKTDWERLDQTVNQSAVI